MANGWGEVNFPDIELFLTGLLRVELAGIAKVRTDLPNPIDLPVVVVRGDGGPQLSVVTELQRFGVTCWAATHQEASGLAARVRSFLVAVNDRPVYRVDKVGGPYREIDPSGAELVYTAFEARVRAVAVN